jgi:hypothetical protein
MVMNALLNHKWGVSAAEDRVWAQVSGMRPSQAVRQFLMALNLQAFVDESATFPNGEFVLAGHIAPAEQWALFSREWEQLLPSAGTLNSEGFYHFKMSEMAALPERMERVPAFYWLIEKYVAVSISCRLNLVDFAKAHARIKAIYDRLNITVDFGEWKNPYFYLFRSLMSRFHTDRHTLEDKLPLSELVDFYFDDRIHEKKVIWAAWDDLLDSMPSEMRNAYGAPPRFENDQKFLPLQAADLWAWWVREWYEEDAQPMPDKMYNFNFGTWIGNKRKLWVLSPTEQDIFNTLSGIISHTAEVTELTMDGRRII